jgi:prepilin-type N-terminal cleavage/methylation domain-containing protein
VAGFTLIEVMFALALAATVSAAAVPQLLASVDDFRAAGAARTLAARLQQTRVRAVARARDTALRVSHDSRGYVIATYEDGNANGVRSADIDAGIDRPIAPPFRVNDQFPGVDFGALPAIPGADGSLAPGTDPVRLGSTDSATFTPSGTATAGSLYVLGGRSAQYVVRIYGETGRTRIMRYAVTSRRWVPL